MTKIEIFDGFIELGNQLKNGGIRIPYDKISSQNPWFISEFVDLSLQGINRYLDPEKLQQWRARYPLIIRPKTVGLVMAGNLPLVGFHDFLCVLMSGHNVVISLSSKDSILIELIIKKLTKISSIFEKRIHLKKSVVGCDALIATGTNNTARYFEYSFRKKPNLIRKNRTSIGIISGKEDATSLNGLSDDIFQYFGLGCRSISFLSIPPNFQIQDLKPFFKKYGYLKRHQPFKNNYLYNKALLKLKGIDFYDFGTILMTETPSILSPIGVVHYQYNGNEKNTELIALNKNQIQCVATSNGQIDNSIPFGTSQKPELWDYNDGKDTMKFLTGL